MLDLIIELIFVGVDVWKKNQIVKVQFFCGKQIVNHKENKNNIINTVKSRVLARLV